MQKFTNFGGENLRMASNFPCRVAWLGHIHTHTQRNQPKVSRRKLVYGDDLGAFSPHRDTNTKLALLCKVLSSAAYSLLRRPLPSYVHVYVLEIVCVCVFRVFLTTEFEYQMLNTLCIFLGLAIVHFPACRAIRKCKWSETHRRRGYDRKVQHANTFRLLLHHR